MSDNRYAVGFCISGEYRVITINKYDPTPWGSRYKTKEEAELIVFKRNLDIANSKIKKLETRNKYLKTRLKNLNK